MNSSIEVRHGLVVLFAVLAVLAVPLGAAGPVAAQEDNSTATETPTATPTACEDPSAPSMDQARLYAPETTITADQAGRIDGGFLLDNGYDCPVVVSATLRVPSGMTISGGSDWQSAGAGLVNAQFTMQPDSGLQDLSANVYSEQTGELRVTGDFEYWPQGHEDMSREVDGLTFTFNVEEPNTAGDTPAQGDNGGSGPIPDIPSTYLLFALALVAIIGIVVVAPIVRMSN